ncbi:hypothetical protein FF011L_09880 [Roseimaritima multifibrata]|uniref:Uncharacterized protein n=1 Tax=Roseimaritima multifibrata TaxID=1930274 RepID=A0A517MBL8_9BACT|nr:hypothetical protein FF011L_09880 [Roseimaritima multifibrata]
MRTVAPVAEQHSPIRERAVVSTAIAVPKFPRCPNPVGDRCAARAARAAGAPAKATHDKLLTDTQATDDIQITLWIFATNVVQQPTTTADKTQQAAA